MTKKAKKRSESPEYDSTREQNVLLDKMSSDVKTIAEKVTANSEKLKKLDIIEKDVTELKADMGIVKTAVQQHTKDIKEVKSELGSVKSELGSVKSELGSVKSELGSVKMAVKDVDTRVDRIEKKLDKVTSDHEQRLQKLEVA